MIRDVVVLPRAKVQLYETAQWWAEHRSVAEAIRWLAEMESEIQSLADDAERFPLAPESEEFDFSLRQMNFGISKKPTHRVLFAVNDRRVRVYAIRHLAQQALKKDDIE